MLHKFHAILKTLKYHLTNKIQAIKKSQVLMNKKKFWLV